MLLIGGGFRRPLYRDWKMEQKLFSWFDLPADFS
jgi:hypothetical protein